MKLHQELSVSPLALVLAISKLKDSGLHYEAITFNFEPF